MPVLPPELESAIALQLATRKEHLSDDDALVHLQALDAMHAASKTPEEMANYLESRLNVGALRQLFAIISPRDSFGKHVGRRDAAEHVALAYAAMQKRGY